MYKHIFLKLFLSINLIFLTLQSDSKLPIIYGVNNLLKIDKKYKKDGTIVYFIGENGTNSLFIYDHTKEQINDGGIIFNGWVRQHNNMYINAKWFGVYGDNKHDDSKAIQNAINYCIAHKKTLFLPTGIYKIQFQLFIKNKYCTNANIDIIGENKNTIIQSHVKGSIQNMDTAGFALVFDGWKNSSLKNITIDYTYGTAGIVIKAENGSSIYNNFSNIEVIGNSKVSQRIKKTKIGIRFVGNEKLSCSKNNVTYYNSITDSRFSNAYKHIEHISGDGFKNTSQPNANKIINVQFDRYTIGIDWNNSDENQAYALFFNNAPGLKNFTYCISTNGQLNKAIFSAEPGKKSKALRLLRNSKNNYFHINMNISHLWDNFSIDNSNIIETGKNIGVIKNINFTKSNKNNELNINFFGNGFYSHIGKGLNKINIWSNNRKTNNCSLGWITSNEFYINVGNYNILNIGGTWTTPVKLGNIFIWYNSLDNQIFMNLVPPKNEKDGIPIK